jgi:hypothetical protein
MQKPSYMHINCNIAVNRSLVDLDVDADVDIQSTAISIVDKNSSSSLGYDL